MSASSNQPSNVAAPTTAPRRGVLSDPGARLTWKVALIGALSALFGALIGVGGSLGVTVLTLNHQDAQEMTDLRRAAYLEFLGAANGVVNQVDNETNLRIESEVVPPSTVLADARRRLALQGELDEPLARVQIYGSKEAVTAAVKLGAAADSVVLQAILYSVQGRTRQDYNKLRAYLSAADSARGEFTAVIRGEVGNLAAK